MRGRMLSIVLLITFLCVSNVRPMQARGFALKSNLLYMGYTRTPNLGLEIELKPRWTFDLSGGYNGLNLEGTVESNKKLIHWFVQPEFRYWLCEAYNGNFFGVHLLGSKYNISQYELPLLFGSGSENYRYQGVAIGAGLSYGYQLPLSRWWGLEFSLGVGCAYMTYDKYKHEKFGELQERGVSRLYFGPTKAGVSLLLNIR